MKSNTLYKQAHNRALALVAEWPEGEVLGPEAALARTLGVSRTTARAVVAGLLQAGILTGPPGARRAGRPPAEQDAFPAAETLSVSTMVEQRFMHWILQGDCRPGQQINSLELGRHLAVSASALRDFLGHFSHFGLIEKRPSGAWVFQGFTADFAMELSDMRELFELRSAARFVARPPNDPAWQALAQLRHMHAVLRSELDTRHTDFSPLDERFHRLINDAAQNRFIQKFYDVISMVFHYHYHWNKADERERNAVAIDEHLAYIAALERRDLTATLAACRAHMQTARASLLRAVPG